MECWGDGLDEADTAVTGGRANTDDDQGSTGGVTSGGCAAEECPIEGEKPSLEIDKKKSTKIK